MTTIIKVEACCGDDKEVEIKITGEETVISQNGEKRDALYVYDDREITVKEIKKGGDGG